MRTPLALLLLIASLASAQVAVKFYSDAPTNHPNRILGIPTNAPFEKLFTNSAPAGFVLFTLEEWKSYEATNGPAWRDWHRDVYEPYWATNAQPTPSVLSNRQANIQALKDLADQMQSAETNWATITDAQVKGLVRVHNQALLRLRSFIQNSYKEHLEKE